MMGERGGVEIDLVVEKRRLVKESILTSSWRPLFQLPIVAAAADGVVVLQEIDRR